MVNQGAAERTTIQSLSEENRRTPRLETVERLVDVRVAYGSQLTQTAPILNAPAAQLAELMPGASGLPEITREALSADTLAAGILTYGALIVRGLYDAGQLQRLKEAAARDAAAGNGRDDRLGCSPRTLFELFEIYQESNLIDAVRNYHGGETVVFGERVKLRCLQKERDKGAGIPWHQDAAFFGSRSYAVNCWAAVTSTGVDCPGLGFIPRRMEALHGWDFEKGHAPLDYGRARSDEELQALLQGKEAVECSLNPGDAVLFDEMTMHRTLPRPWRQDKQMVTISWFFAPGNFPGWGVPLAV